MSKVTKFKFKPKLCQYCGESEHVTEWACPRIKSVGFDPDENYWQIEFFSPAELAGITFEPSFEVDGETPLDS